jgi:hypothetical protein
MPNKQDMVRALLGSKAVNTESSDQGNINVMKRIRPHTGFNPMRVKPLHKINP